MSDDKKPNADITGSGTPPSATPPNRYNCRAKHAGFGNYVVCLEPPPHHCGYALSMGDEYLCLHPHSGQFAADTINGNNGWASTQQ